MKYLLLSLSLWAFAGHAEDVCNSVWVFKPWKTCSDARNGLDFSKATPIRETTLTSDKVPGNTPEANQDTQCKKLADSLKMDLKDYAVRAQKISATDKGEPDLSKLGKVYYVYTCKLQVLEVPYKTKGAACGTEDKYQYQVQGSSAAIDGEAHCLSCDNETTQEGVAKCLTYAAANWSQIAQDVSLRPDDLAKINQKIGDLLRVEKASPSLNFDDKVKIVNLSEQLQKSEPAKP